MAPAARPLLLSLAKPHKDWEESISKDERKWLTESGLGGDPELVDSEIEERNVGPSCFVPGLASGIE